MMRNDTWSRRLNEFKRSEQPGAVLLVANSPELMRILVAWTQTDIARATRITASPNASEEESWTWLWKNVQYDREKFLARIPNGNKRTPANLDALIASRVLYPDGTINQYVERYLKERVIKLFSRSLQKGLRATA